MLAIGIDIGGTSIKGAFIKENGEILSKFSMKMDQNASPEDVINPLCDLIIEEINKYHYEDIKGIGIGMPGTLDIDEGIVIHSPNLIKWDNFPLKSLFEKRTGLETLINNDANVAALGEAKFGSGAKYQNIIMLTLGTGVGGGIIFDGKIYDGNKHQGAELGHAIIELNGRQCTCGRRGCIEAYASATALIKDTKECMDKNPDSLLHQIKEELGTVDARNAFIAAKKGDKAAINLVDNYVMYLSEALLNYCNIFRPNAIILSGGVANEGDYLFDKIKEYLKVNTYGMRGSEKVEVLPSLLGYDSGKIGAACLIIFK